MPERKVDHACEPTRGYPLYYYPARRFRFVERAMLRASKAIICFDNVVFRLEETSPPVALARYHCPSSNVCQDEISALRHPRSLEPISKECCRVAV